MKTYTISKHIPGGWLDQLEVERIGLLRIRGWSLEPLRSLPVPIVRVGAIELPLLQTYRYSRDDIGQSANDLIPYSGVLFEYLLPDWKYDSIFSNITVVLNNYFSIDYSGHFQFLKPHYRNLLSERKVLHRDHIYASGPPVATVNEAVLSLTAEEGMTVLDFGCGSGALVDALVTRHINAYGLEIDSEEIRNSLFPNIQDRVSLYDGTFPTHWSENSFDIIVCSEVLEHIADYKAAVREMARLTSNKIIVTVPDMSAIPLGFHDLLVPWHLLEASHLNFFTQQSLSELLHGYFYKVQFGRQLPYYFPGSSFYMALLAIASSPFGHID